MTQVLARAVRVVALTGCAVASISRGVAAAVPVFERVEPTEIRTGVVRLRTLEGPLLEVPVLADDWTVTGWRNERFARLYAIQFFLETRREGHAPVVDELGALLLAVRGDQAELLARDERIRTRLSALGADAFTADRLQVLDTEPPFDQLQQLSEEPSWSCSGRYDRTRVLAHRAHFDRARRDSSGKAIRVALGWRGVADVSRRLCPGLLQAAETASAEELRTMPLPRELHELSVRVETARPLADEVDVGELLPLPPASSLSRRSVDTGASGETTKTPADGSSSYAKWLLARVEWEATTVPSSLSADRVARHASVSRWTIVETVRRLGPDVLRDERTTGGFTFALVPLAALAEPSSPVPLRLDQDAMLEEVGKRLDARSDVDVEVLEEAVVVRPEGLRSPPGWMSVLCRRDGTAWFGLPPTKARSPVTNPALVCAALDARLP